MTPWILITDFRDPAFGGKRYEIDPDHDDGDTAAIAYQEPLEDHVGPDGRHEGWHFWHSSGRILCERS